MNQRTPTPGQRAEPLGGGRGRQQLIIVPGVLALTRRLHLIQINRMQAAAIGPDGPRTEAIIVGRHRLHPRHRRRSALFRLGNPHRRDCLQIVERSGIAPGLSHAGPSLSDRAAATAC